MKRRILSLAIVLCMVLTLFPATVFAAESYGIYVGSTEVTSANYKNITGPGISGKVYYDPEQHELVLDNATITSYTNTSNEDGISDLAGLFSLWDTLTIQVVGNCTVQPNLSGKNAQYCSGIASVGLLIIESEDGGTLNVLCSGAENNVGVLSHERILAADITFNVESGNASGSFSYGIYAPYFGIEQHHHIPKLTVKSGNCPNGESVGIVASSNITFNDVEGYHTVKSGTAQFSAAIISDFIFLESNICATAGTSTLSDSIALAANDITFQSGSFEFNAGISDAGSSIAILSASYVNIYCGKLTAKSGSAPNGASIGITCEQGCNFNETCNTVIQAGDGYSSAGIVNTGYLNLGGEKLICRAGTATTGNSCGIINDGYVLIYPTELEIHAGDAPNGSSIGIATTQGIELQVMDPNDPQPERKITITGKTQSIDGSFTMQAGYGWAGNPVSTAPVSDYRSTALGDPSQYKFLQIIKGDFELPTPFIDVPKGVYYVDPVLWAVETKLTTGVTPDTFCPKDTCTRAQVVSFLWRACGSPAPVSTNNPFVDVKEGKYYYDAVLWAVENGITNGMTETTFGPNEGCTRGQVATFLWRCLYQPAAANPNNPFCDVSEGKFYYDAVLWAAENGITTGTDATHFSPNDACTRAQIVTFLWRAADDLAERPDDFPSDETPGEPSEPTDPAEPSEPSEAPTDPSEESTEPTETPTEPADEPSDPVADPTEDSAG